MKMLEQMRDSINEELEGAREYAEKYILNKAMGKPRAAAYKAMAQDELRHASHVYGFAVEDVEAIRRVHALSPEDEEMWERELKHYADCDAKIKMMLS